MNKTAFITGITGQDGAYLSQLLLEQGYKVIGGKRRQSSLNLWRLEYLKIADDIEILDFDLGDATNLEGLLKENKVDEFYNLAAQSFVASSFHNPIIAMDSNGLGALRCLNAIHKTGLPIRFYQASTSEMFGKVQETPQTEKTPFYPRSPYGIAKLMAHWVTINYREAYNLFACSGILFNHESPLRGIEFVTRKIVNTLVKIKQGAEEVLELGNIHAKRDWGFAGDYVRAMHLMLQQPTPDDYVIATGETYSVQEFITLVAKHLDWTITWEQKDDQWLGFAQDGKMLIKTTAKFHRPAEVDLLIGDASKAKEKLGWSPAMKFETLVEHMVQTEQQFLGRSRLPLHIK